ncbi:MAG: SBBP repeat-containing protein [Thermoplasmata archaeon]|nr:MAG: SBBP repeat-containing protein [Thermoplasmata archaeon]
MNPKIRKIFSLIMSIFIVATIFMFEVPNKVQAQPTEEWVDRYNGLGDKNDYIEEIAVDSSGNLIVAGTCYKFYSKNDFLTIKYDPQGNKLWEVTFDAYYHHDFLHAMTIDDSQNIYVTGANVGLGTDEDFVTIKYDSDGNEIWVKRYNGPDNYKDSPSDIAVDPQGNVYVTGYSYGIDTRHDYITIKYDSSGNEQWVARYNGPGVVRDYANAIAVDSNKNVFVTGRSYSLDYYFDFVTIKYDANGNQIWINRYNGPGFYFDNATAIVLDSSENIYVTGVSFGKGKSYDYATVAYDQQGNTLWISRFNGPGNGDDFVSAMRLDPFDNIIVTGYSHQGRFHNYDYVTIKYDRNGNELWIARYNGPENRSDVARDIYIDRYGNTYVTGSSENPNNITEFVTIKYDTMGNEQFIKKYERLNSDRNEGQYLVVDAEGNIYVCGYCIGLGTYLDFITIKYSPPSQDQLIFADAGEDQTVYEGDLVHFDGSNSSVSEGEILEYQWDFDASIDSDGDGNPTNDVDATGPTPTYMYVDNGIYTATLTVRSMVPRETIQKVDQDVMLVIDSSNSMLWNDHIDMRIHAAKSYLNCLIPDDRMGVVNFDTSAYLQELNTDYRNIVDILEAIDSFGGDPMGIPTTSVSPALDLAISELTENGDPNHEWVIILLSDLEVIHSDVDDIYVQIDRAAANGIRIYTVGLNADTPLLGEIANATYGMFYQNPNSSNMKAIFQNVSEKAGNTYYEELSDNDTCEITVISVPDTIEIDPDTLNLDSKGRWITCYIYLHRYDVNDIDISSIMLEDLILAEWGDIQNDTLMVKFDRSEVEDFIGAPNESIELTVRGELFDGTSFQGSDTIRVIDPGK